MSHNSQNKLYYIILNIQNFPFNSTTDDAKTSKIICLQTRFSFIVPPSANLKGIFYIA